MSASFLGFEWSFDDLQDQSLTVSTLSGGLPIKSPKKWNLQAELWVKPDPEGDVDPRQRTSPKGIVGSV